MATDMQDDDCLTEDEWFELSNPKEVRRAIEVSRCYPKKINPQRMLQFVRRIQRADRTKQGRRRLRLFACACCRPLWSQLSEQSRVAIEIAERFADGLASKKDMGFAWRTTVHEGGDLDHEWTADHVAGCVVEASAMTAAALTTMMSYTVFAKNRPTPDVIESWEECARQAVIIRDIFGNPFRPNKPNPDLMSGEVTDLARKIYDDRSFHLIPRLAELLELAGCNNSEILNHCRNGEPHVRGCWVVDMFLNVSR